VVLWTTAPDRAARAAAPPQVNRHFSIATEAGQAVASPSAAAGPSSLLNHRERKQVYMHSAIFVPGGPPSQSLYALKKQYEVLGKLRKSHEVLQQPRMDPQPMRPADYRATANSGHGVLIMDTQPTRRHTKQDGNKAVEVPGPTFVKIEGDKDVLRFVPARSRESDDAIPREHWAAGTNLEWSDKRNELCSRRGQEFFNTWKCADAGSRKRQELSSEVFGSPRMIERSNSKPYQDIWPVCMTYTHNVDSTLQVPRQQSSPTLGPRESARDRKARAMRKSEGSQFPESEPPPPSRRVSRKSAPSVVSLSDEIDAEAKRRSERNYSDIFGTPKYEPRRDIVREDLTWAANTNFLDSIVEIGGRHKRRQKSTGEVGDSSTHPLFLGSCPSTARSPRCSSPVVPAAFPEERACWDTDGGMDAAAEIARRARKVLHRGTSPCEHERTPSERRRAEMTSAQVRRGAGMSPVPWDDGRAAPSPPFGSPTILSRSLNSSPAGRGFREAWLDSARARKVQELMSEIF